jgi:uncharacterized ion transporter superfamily protein YfcC
VLSALGTDFGTDLTALIAGIGTTIGPYLLVVLIILVVITVVIFIVNFVRHQLGLGVEPEDIGDGMLSYRYDDEENLTKDFGPDSDDYEDE